MAESQVDKREIFGWSMFDFANSAFTTVMVTSFFAIYFVGDVVGRPADADPDAALRWFEDGQVLWGISLSITKALVMISAPLLGAFADFSGAKKKFLLFFYLGCIALTASLGIVGEGEVKLAMVLFILANFCFSSTEYFISAFLPEIAPSNLIGRISGLAWGLGYFGGIGALICSVVILEVWDRPYSWVWIMVAAWFFVCGLPTFIFVKERHKHEALPPGQSVYLIGFTRLVETAREASKFRQLLRFLVIYAIFNCGIESVIGYASLIAKELMDFDVPQLGVFLIVLNLVAACGAFGGGWLQDKIGTRRTISLALFGWLSAVVLAAFIKPDEAGNITTFDTVVFWTVGALVGLSMGATFSASRALVGLFSPIDRSAEFFGLWAVSSRAGAVVGPLVFAGMTSIAGMRAGVLSLGVFFALGLGLMWTVNEVEGRRASGHG